MKDILPGVIHQPDFPRTDLSDDNADILELLLANADLVQLCHEESEKTSWVFRVGHPAVVRGAERIYDDRLTDAVNHGVATFEAMSLFVNAVPSPHDSFTVNSNGAALAKGMRELQLQEYYETAYETFHRDTPRAAEVVRSASTRFYQSLTGYALLGAAIARQFELDSI